MSLKSFFFPKNFQGQMKRGQRKSVYVMQLGMDRVKRRSEKWLQFFMWMPIIGNLVFMREGKKELAERKK